MPERYYDVCDDTYVMDRRNMPVTEHLDAGTAQLVCEKMNEARELALREAAPRVAGTIKANKPSAIGASA